MGREKIPQKSYICLRLCWLAAGGFLAVSLLFWGSSGSERSDIPPCPASPRRALPEEIVEVLSQSLGDKNWQVRFHAATALGEIGGQAKTSIPFLLEAMRDRSAMVRYAAVCAVGSVDPRNEAVLHALLTAMDDPESDVRAAAADSLGSAGPRAVPLLVKACRDRNSLVRLAAVRSLGKSAAAQAEITTVLVNALRDDNDEVRAAAALALGEIRAQGEAETAALIQSAGEFGEVRYAAIEALGKLGAEAAVPHLVNELRYDDVKETAAMALVEIGKKSPQAVSVLIQTFIAGDSEIRYEICEILGKTRAVDAVPAFIAALSEEGLGDCAAGALVAIGDRAVPALADHVDRVSGSTKLKAMVVLGEIGGEDAVTVLVRQLEDPGADVRSGAAMALGKIAAHPAPTAGHLSTAEDPFGGR